LTCKRYTKVILSQLSAHSNFKERIEPWILAFKHKIDMGRRTILKENKIKFNCIVRFSIVVNT
jgi:hypothetical protein